MKKMVSFFKTKPQEAWYLAFREKKDKCLYDKNGKDFLLVKNPLRYWCADPFLFFYKGKHYVFAELFDKKVRHGVVGVAEIKNNRIGRFRVCLRLSNHLSYPCVFQKGNDIYMLPENYQSGKIALYRATEFPYKWEEYSTIADIQGVDTTPYFGQDEIYFTTIECSGSAYNANLYSICENNIRKINDNDKTIRCAGHFIQTPDNLIRPSQDDNIIYGNRLKFSKVNVISQKDYQEETMFFVKAPNNALGDNEISIILKNKTTKNFYGCHTYNVDDGYEIIDLVTKEYSLYDFFRTLKLMIKHLLK